MFCAELMIPYTCEKCEYNNICQIQKHNRMNNQVSVAKF